MPIPRSRLTRQSFQPRGKGGRLTEWAAIVSTAAVTVPANSDVAVTEFSASSISELVPATLIRMRGEVLVMSDQASADELQIGSIGACVVRDPARIAGIVAMPTPFLDGGDDVWMWYQFLNSRGENGAGTVIGTVAKSYEIDVKSMRKMVDGDALVINASNHHATFGLQVIFQCRFLFLLH